MYIKIQSVLYSKIQIGIENFLPDGVRLEDALLGVIGFLRKMIKMAKTQKLKISYFLNFIVKDLNHFDSNDCIWSLEQNYFHSILSIC